MTDDIVNLASDDPDELWNEDEVDASTNANTLKPKERITNDDGMSNRSSNKADDSPKDTHMGIVGSESVPALTTKPVPNKGGVGFAGDVEMIYNKDGKLDNNQLINDNTALNSSSSLQVIAH